MTRPRTIAVMLTPKKLFKLPIADPHFTLPHTNIILLHPHSYLHQLDSVPQVDLLLHKLADFSAEAHSSLDLHQYRHDIEERISSGRILKVVDSFESMELLQCRREMLIAMEAVIKGTRLRVPEWSMVWEVVKQWPFVIGKPMDACGHADSHIMKLIRKDDQYSAQEGFIYQRFLPHHCTLFKFYIIGDSVDVVVRRSVSLDIFKDMSMFEYGVTVGKACLEDDSDALEMLAPFNDDIMEFISRFREEHKLTLFGVDVIVGEEDNMAYVIDVNYFPGFDGVAQFPEKFSKVLL